ncbi:histidine kinase [Mobilicoccus sp.]|uniref:sensor histidine kinase n=1 Tax=Mobilicoccus sp. TaxID=2034349 RepID=UPI00289A9F85|nr:histidine kinase [Mobilicoccus sp.]
MRARFVGLFWRVFLGNAAILVLATLTLALTPATVSYPVEVREVAVLVIGLLLMSVANLWFLRSALGPLARLQAAVESLETPARDRAVPVVRDDEVGRVTAAFNDMLTRLETERRRATGAALSAQERERNRVSRDLHDGVGQTLTVLLLQLAGLREAAPPGLAPEIDAAREQARQALDAVRQVSRELRPGPLRELGLGPALRGLSEEITDASGVGVTVHLPPGVDLDDLQDAVQLGIYRIVQESLTNVVRHAEASRADVDVGVDEDQVVVVVADDGHGGRAEPGTGLLGMSERARILGGRLSVNSRAGEGTTVTVTVPLRTDHATGENPS